MLLFFKVLMDLDRSYWLCYGRCEFKFLAWIDILRMGWEAIDLNFYLCSFRLRMLWWMRTYRWLRSICARHIILWLCEWVFGFFVLVVSVRCRSRHALKVGVSDHFWPKLRQRVIWLVMRNMFNCSDIRDRLLTVKGCYTTIRWLSLVWYCSVTCQVAVELMFFEVFLNLIRFEDWAFTGYNVFLGFASFRQDISGDFLPFWIQIRIWTIFIVIIVSVLNSWRYGCHGHWHSIWWLTRVILSVVEGTVWWWSTSLVNAWHSTWQVSIQGISLWFSWQHHYWL